MDREAHQEEEPAEEIPRAQGEQDSWSKNEEGWPKVVVYCSRGHREQRLSQGYSKPKVRLSAVRCTGEVREQGLQRISSNPAHHCVS